MEDPFGLLDHVQTVATAERRGWQKSYNCHTFALSVIEHVVNRSSIKPIKEKHIAYSECRLNTLLDIHKDYKMSFEDAMVKLIENNCIISFHAYTFETVMNFNNQMRAPDHSGIVLPISMQLSNNPSIQQCLVIEREALTYNAKNHRHLGDGIGIKNLNYALTNYRKFSGFEVKFYPWKTLDINIEIDKLIAKYSNIESL